MRRHVCAGVVFVLGVGLPAPGGAAAQGVGGCANCPAPARGVLVPTSARAGLQPSPMLGSFYPTPVMTVGGNGFTGGSGYTPLEWYGGGTLAMYGPFASLRATAAPVTLYRRDFSGRVRPEVATSFSYPFLPPAAPVVYPTRAQVRGTIPVESTPPWWQTGHGWVDMN
jgi:hypothetical protein